MIWLAVYLIVLALLLLFNYAAGELSSPRRPSSSQELDVVHRPARGLVEVRRGVWVRPDQAGRWES